MKTKLFAIVASMGFIACGTATQEPELVDSDKIDVKPLPTEEAMNLPGIITMMEIDANGNVVSKESRQLQAQGMKFESVNAAELAFANAQTNSVNEDTSADSYYGYPNTYGNYNHYNPYQTQSRYPVNGCQNFGQYNNFNCNNYAYQAWPTYYRPQYQYDHYQYNNRNRHYRPNYSYGYRYPSCNSYQRPYGRGGMGLYFNWEKRLK